MVVSWHSLQPVLHPRVLLGRLDGRLEQVAHATTVSYADAKSGQTVYAHHARIAALRPDTAYLYGALHDGAEPRFGAFRTAPRGRAPSPSPASATRARRPSAANTSRPRA